MFSVVINHTNLNSLSNLMKFFHIYSRYLHKYICMRVLEKNNAYQKKIMRTNLLLIPFSKHNKSENNPFFRCLKQQFKNRFGQRNCEFVCYFRMFRKPANNQCMFKKPSNNQWMFRKPANNQYMFRKLANIQCMFRKLANNQYMLRKPANNQCMFRKLANNQ